MTPTDPALLVWLLVAFLVVVLAVGLVERVE